MSNINSASCTECDHCVDCTSCNRCQNCKNCYDCYYCINCTDLRHAAYYIDNSSVTYAEYHNYLAAQQPQGIPACGSSATVSSTQEKTPNPDVSDDLKNLKSYRYESNWDN